MILNVYYFLKKTETEQIYEKIIRDLAASYGKPYPWEVRMRILGTTERRTCEIAVQELGLPCTVDDFQKQFSQSCLDNLGNCNLMKGEDRQFIFGDIILT